MSSPEVVWSEIFNDSTEQYLKLDVVNIKTTKDHLPLRSSINDCTCKHIAPDSPHFLWWQDIYKRGGQIRKHSNKLEWFDMLLHMGQKQV